MLLINQCKLDFKRFLLVISLLFVCLSASAFVPADVSSTMITRSLLAEEKATAEKSVNSTISQKQQQPEQVIVPQGREVLSFYPVKNKALYEKSRLSAVPLAYPAQPVTRLKPLIEFGDDFLGNGPITPGVKTPFEQMLQPTFLLYGSFRNAMQSVDREGKEITQWSTRLDLHGDVKLSGTERLVFSLRPLDKDNGEGTGFNFNSDNNEDNWQDETNNKLTQLFFEGEIGEIFPRLDPNDSKTWDIGFSVGRQEVKVQDGILLNDIIDTLGVTRNSLIFSGIPNLRITALYGWDDIDNSRGDAPLSAKVLGLLSQADTSWDSTFDLDALFVDNPGDADAWYLGLGLTQRLNGINTTFRINNSLPVHQDKASTGQGTLLTAELSGTFKGADNIWYLNSFLSLDDFISAGRSPDAGLPIASLGMLYSPVGMGAYGVPLGDSIANTYGLVMGYQRFFDGISSQFIVELGARSSTKGENNEDAVGLAFRYQKALGRRTLLRFDTFVADQEQQQTSKGVRVEWLVKF